MKETQVRVDAFPEAGRERLEELKPHHLRIAVKEPALRGLATARIRTLVAFHYRVPLSQVRLITGARSPHKRFGVILPE